MREYPSLSIIIPVLNMEETIGQTLDSLMELDYPGEKLEIVVVDGYSVDNTVEIVRGYPVKLVYQEGKGLNAARNTGIKNSSGEIIAFTDGDCVIPRDWAKKLVDNFSDESIGFVGGSLEGVDKTNIWSNYADESLFQVSPNFTNKWETNSLIFLQFPAGANMAFRRTALARIKFFDENITYGFDDLQPVEAMSLKGFKMIFDPGVKVYHHHRRTLMNLLKQHFNYGRGGSLLMIHRRNSFLASWFAAFLIASLFFTFLVAFLVYLGLKINHALPLNIVSWLLGSFFLLAVVFYLPVSLKTMSPWKPFLYPLIDLLRGGTFMLGGLYQLTRSLSAKVS